jgi:hypothetical protein
VRSGRRRRRPCVDKARFGAATPPLAREHLAEPAHDAQPFHRGLCAQRPHRGELLREIGFGDPKDTFADDRRVFGRSGVERDEQGRRVTPEVEPRIIMDHLDSPEKIPPAAFVRQRHSVDHELRVDAIRVVHEQVERALGHDEGLRGERGGFHRSG